MAWLSDYEYRQQITINATVAGAQTNYQMKLTVHKGAGDSSGSDVYLKDHAKSWPGTVPNDIRFTKADGETPLNYWIESSDADTATVWVEFDSIPAPGSVNFYIYYGKAAVSSASDGGRAFNYFDDFEKDTLDMLFPAGRETPGAFWDVAGNKIYLIGGEDVTEEGTTTIYSFNPQTYAIATEAETLPIPLGTIYDAVVWDSVNRLAYIYGGKTQYAPSILQTDKIHKYDVDADSVVALTETLPQALGGVTAVLTPGNIVYIFGGLKDGNTPTVNTIYKHNIGTGTVTTLAATLPDILAFMSHAYDPVNNVIYLYGGYRHDGTTASTHDEIYKFDVATETITTLPETLPQTRDSTIAIYRNGYAYIFAGYTQGGPYFDTIIRHDIAGGATSIEDDTIEKRTDDFCAVFDPVSDQGWLLPVLPNFAADNDQTKQRYLERFSFNGLKVETTWESKWQVGGGTPVIAASELILADASVREFINSPWYFGVNKALRVRMRLVTYSISGAILSVNTDTDTGSAVLSAEIFWNPDATHGYTRSWTAEPREANAIDLPAGYAIFDIIRNGSTNIIFYRNGILLATHTTDVPTNNLYIVLNCRALGELRFDWVLVRKYASPEPTWGAWGSEEELTTAPPTVTTNPATGLGPIAAIPNGTLAVDGGEVCECGFEWGLDTGYGTITATESKTTGQTFSQVIGGLAPNTTYHFRAFAINSAGTGYGADRTFTTALVISRAFALTREEL